MRSLTVRCFVFVALLFAPNFATAQTSTISGTVRDASGGVLPGVTVEASSPALIEKFRGQTAVNAAPLHHCAAGGNAALAVATPQEADETERALRDALEKLQRMSGGA